MEPATAVDPAFSVWWLRHGWFLLWALVLLFLASLTTRKWGPPLIVLVGPKRLSWQDTTRNEVGGRTRQKMAGLVVRFLGNTPLLAGTVLISAILAATLAPQALAPYGPEQSGRVLQTIRGVLMVSPFPPSPTYPLGTDILGRDLLSRIIYGARRTLGLCLAVGIFRLVIGGTLGGVAGWRKGAVGQQILSLVAVSAAIPSLLFAFVFILAIGPELGFGVFLLGLGLTGWAELTNVVNGAVRWMLSRPHMESALAIGSSQSHIIRRHLLPNLAPQLLPAIALELSAVLLTLGELGFLGMFLGEPFYEYVPQSLRSPGLPEWAGMLAGTRLSLFQWPWLPLGPALAFLIAILGFNLLATGLRGWMDPYRSS